MDNQLVDEYYEAEAVQAANYAEFMEKDSERYTGTIHYGFGKEYLPKWGIREALREIYQNFIDYGDYTEEYSIVSDMVCVKLTNGWTPTSLEYLRIGNTGKENGNAIGHHGEGLKMAFLILMRSGFTSMIFTNRYAVYPEWYHDAEIGDCFCFNYEVHDFHESPYTLEFECLAADWLAFKDNLIAPEDIIYTHHEYGELLSKEPGNIYSGGLFVANLKGISRSYNIKPHYMPLDRDRCVPQAFNVEYYSAKILEASEVLNVKDLGYSDTRYISKLPARMYDDVKPRKVGNNIEFTIKDEAGKDQIISNSNLKDHLKSHSLFQKAIARIKKMMAKHLGVYDLLVAFRDKHIHGADALSDFNVILSKIEK
jgi:hypothetical protein